MDPEDIGALIVTALESKIRELEEKRSDLHREYWPRIEHALMQLKRTTCKMTAQRVGETIGEYRGKKDQIQDTIDYLTRMIPHVQRTCAQAATDADDGFDHEDMGFELPSDDYSTQS